MVPKGGESLVTRFYPMPNPFVRQAQTPVWPELGELYAENQIEAESRKIEAVLRERSVDVIRRTNRTAGGLLIQ